MRFRKVSHSFYIKVESGASYDITGPFTLNVYCGPNSAILSESSYDQTQWVAVGNTSAFFSFTPWTSISDCEPIKYTIVWIAKDTVALDPFIYEEILAEPGVNTTAFAPETNTACNYEFYIIGEAEGGYTLTSGDKILVL